jgi:hypothetical protein
MARLRRSGKDLAALRRVLIQGLMVGRALVKKHS